jgi:hypothetical protein
MSKCQSHTRPITSSFRNVSSTSDRKFRSGKTRHTPSYFRSVWEKVGLKAYGLNMRCTECSWSASLSRIGLTTESCEFDYRLSNAVSQLWTLLIPIKFTEIYTNNQTKIWKVQDDSLRDGPKLIIINHIKEDKMDKACSTHGENNA